MRYPLEEVPSAALKIDTADFTPGASAISECRLNDAGFVVDPATGCAQLDVACYSLALLGLDMVDIGRRAFPLRSDDSDATIIKLASTASERVAKTIDAACVGRQAVARSIMPAIGQGAIRITNYSTQFVPALNKPEKMLLEAVPLHPTNESLVALTGLSSAYVRNSLGIVARMLNVHGRAAIIMMAYLHGPLYKLPDPFAGGLPGQS